jgi:hypothetical protein
MEQRDSVAVVKTLFLAIHNLSVEVATLRGLLQKNGVVVYQDFESLHRKIYQSVKNEQIRVAVANLDAESDLREVLACFAKPVS